ncbi:hypothetical protein VP01_9462g1, partial [Puccinia sorghi]
TCSAAPSLYDAIVNLFFSFFYHKLIFLKTNNTVQKLILDIRNDSDGRLGDLAFNNLAANKIDQAGSRAWRGNRQLHY